MPAGDVMLACRLVDPSPVIHPSMEVRGRPTPPGLKEHEVEFPSFVPANNISLESSELELGSSCCDSSQGFNVLHKLDLKKNIELFENFTNEVQALGAALLRLYPVYQNLK